MTKQEIFDTVVKHLLTQKSKSLMSGTTWTCAYRGADGKKCAIGCLIPDELYDSVFERAALSAIDDGYVSPRQRKLIDVLEKIGIWEHRDLLEELQRVHDDLLVCDWEHYLRKYATQIGLVFPL